jgi:hypothetical protein
MKKVKVIPEKVIKQKEIVEIACDVCGREVESYWWAVTNYDGVNYEYTSPIDLCHKHQHLYEQALRELPYPFKYMVERYDNPCKTEDIEVLFGKIKELHEIEEDNRWN